MTRDEGGNGWEQYQKLVLKSLEDIKESAKGMETRLREIELELALLKLKSSFWGGLAGLGAFAATWLIQYIARRP